MNRANGRQNARILKGHIEFEDVESWVQYCLRFSERHAMCITHNLEISKMGARSDRGVVFDVRATHEREGGEVG